VIRRREDPRLVTGAGQFIDDLEDADCVHVAILRSPHAHARIRSVQTGAALKQPGVVTAVTGADLGPANAPIPVFNMHPGLPKPCGMPPLAIGRVRFVGEPVAAVVATSPYLAYDALDAIAVDWEPLPAVAEVQAALAGDAAIVHEAPGTNVAAEWTQRVGDADAAFREAEVVARTTLRLSRGGAHPLETRGLIARWTDGRLTAWAAVQMVHRHRKFIAGQLGLPETRVRVIAPADVGGGFGTKGTLASYVERDQVHHLEIAATRDGRILGLRDDFLHELGAYTASRLNLPQNTMIHSTGVYRIPSLYIRMRGRQRRAAGRARRPRQGTADRRAPARSVAQGHRQRARHVLGEGPADARPGLG